MIDKHLSKEQLQHLFKIAEHLRYPVSSYSESGINCIIDGRLALYNPYRNIGQAFELLTNVIVDDPFAEAQISFGDNQLCIDLCYNTTVGSTDYEPQQKRWAICQLICKSVLHHIMKE